MMSLRTAPRILVIDDEPPVRQMLAQMLGRAGYEVEEAEDGVKAIELLKQNPADIVITDMIMPNKEGMDTIMEICRDFPELKVIAISGGGDIGAQEYLSIASRCGALKTFAKPLSRDDMLSAIEELLKLS